MFSMHLSSRISTHQCMLKNKTLFILFIVAPLSPHYSDHPSALRLLHLIDAGLIQNLVLNNVLSVFAMLHLLHYPPCPLPLPPPYARIWQECVPKAAALAQPSSWESQSHSFWAKLGQNITKDKRVYHGLLSTVEQGLLSVLLDLTQQKHGMIMYHETFHAVLEFHPHH